MNNSVITREYIFINQEEFIDVCNVGLDEKDFAIVNSSSHGLLMFCHGTEDGYILLNNKEYTLEDLSKIIGQNIYLRVVCCYGAYITPYEDKNTKIEPLVYYDGEIYVDTNYYATTGCLIVYPH
jgi:hypothetical protein